MTISQESAHVTRNKVQPGQVYGILTVRAKSLLRRRWDCMCECGVVRVVWSSGLLSGASRSCGSCVRWIVHEKIRVHGGTARTDKGRRGLYQIWVSMRARCNCPTNKAFKHYGGRGITVCPEWNKSFSAFERDVGVRPKGAQLDRRDNDAGYSPSNCAWATVIQQANNRRGNVVVDHLGKTQTITQWSRELGIKACTLLKRYRKGLRGLPLFGPVGRWVLTPDN